MNHEKGLIKNGAVPLDDDQLDALSGGLPQSLQTGGTPASDGNCGNPVNLIEGKCHFHPSHAIPNCNSTCPYYYDTN